MASIREEISSSKFYTGAVNNIEKAVDINNIGGIVKIVCFGLGSFSDCLISLHQLAFILEIQKYFKIIKIEFHDPIFSKLETSLLNEINCEVLEENCEGKYKVDDITIFYLPHCPKQLTNNLLWKNWNEYDLNRIILISNSFENLKRNTPERFLKEDAEYILKICDFTAEYSIDNNYQFSDVFNDTSIHVFCKTKLNNVPEDFWIKSNDEPKYCDTELITKELEIKLKINEESIL